MTYALREKQQQLKIKQHKLIQDCVTRWGSTLSTIERILEQRVAVCAVLIENRSDRTLIPTPDEFTILEELASVLNPKKATELLSGSKYATVSCMFPVLQQLLLNSLKMKEEDPPVLKSIKESIAQDLSTRYQEHALKSLLKMTSFLDPRFKEQPYLTESEKTAVMLNTREELADLIEECMTTSDPPTADLVVNLDEDPPPPSPAG